MTAQEYEDELEKERVLLEGQLKQSEKEKDLLTAKVTKLEESKH